MNTANSLNEFITELRTKACRNNAVLVIGYSPLGKDSVDRSARYTIEYRFDYQKNGTWKKGSKISDICTIPNDEPEDIEDIINKNSEFFKEKLDENKNKVRVLSIGSKKYLRITRSVGNKTEYDKKNIQ